MKRLLSLILAIILVLPSFALYGCGKKKEEQRVLRISNCEDYISVDPDGTGEYVDLIAKFEEETGIKVEYSTYATNENLYNELVINPKSYDLVIPSEYMIQKLATEGRLKKLDTTKVDNFKNVSPFIIDTFENISFVVKAGDYEGETLTLNDFAVGYMWGTMGWVYNTENVDQADVTTWNKVFESGNYNKRMTLKDSVRDSYLVGLGMVYEDELFSAISSGEDVNAKVNEIFNRIDDDAINAVGDKLTSLKSQLYGFEVDSGKNDIVTGKIDAYVAWSGDACYAIDEAYEDDVALDYYVPDCGSNIWFDGMVMPAKAENVDEAYEFINFICDEQNAVDNMDYIGYTSVVSGETVFGYIVENFDESEDLLPEECVEVDLSYFFGAGSSIFVSEESFGRMIAQYPTEEIATRCAVMSYFDDDTLISINKMWESVKGSTFPLGMLIFVGILVVLIIAVILLYRNKDKIKWLKMPELKKKSLTDKGYKVVDKQDL